MKFNLWYVVPVKTGINRVMLAQEWHAF